MHTLVLKATIKMSCLWYERCKLHKTVQIFSLHAKVSKILGTEVIEKVEELVDVPSYLILYLTVTSYRQPASQFKVAL